MAKQKEAMNKADLIELMMKSKQFETKAAAERALEVVLDGIRRGLKKNSSVRLINFGTFEVRKRKRRKGLNPRTQEPMMIPASRTVAFRVGKQLKEYIS